MGGVCFYTIFKNVTARQLNTPAGPGWEKMIQNTLSSPAEAQPNLEELMLDSCVSRSLLNPQETKYSYVFNYPPKEGVPGSEPLSYGEVCS